MNCIPFRLPLVLLLICWLVPGTYSTAQTLVDPYSNETLKLQSIRRKMPQQPDQEIFWLAATDTSNPRYAAIERISREVANSYSTPQAWMQVRRDFFRRCSTYNDINLILNEGRGEPPISLSETPTSYEIICSGLGLIKRHLFYQVKLSLTPLSEDSRFDFEPVTLVYLHVIDLKKGTSTPLAPLPEKEANALRDAILPKVQAQFDRLDTVPPDDYSPIEIVDPMDDDAYYEEQSGRLPSIWHSHREEVPRTPEDGKVGPAIQMQEAMVSWQGLGLRVAFADFSETSRIFHGKGFSVTIPLHEADSILGKLPQWAFLRSIRPAPTKARNFDKDLLWERFSIHQRIAQLECLPLLNRVNAIPKQLEIQATRANSSNPSEVDTIWIEFHPSGELAFSAQAYAGQRKVCQCRRTYDASGRLLEEMRFSKGNCSQPIEHIKNTYHLDDKGNVVQKTLSPHDDWDAASTLYVRDFAYSVRDAFFRVALEEQVLVARVRKPIVMYGYSFDMAADGWPRNVKSTTESFQVRSDAQGRILEYHWDRDRYQNLYTYDEMGRITKYQFFADGKLKNESIFEYEGAAPLPYAVTRKTIDWNRENVSRASCKWTY